MQVVSAFAQQAYQAIGAFEAQGGAHQFIRKEHEVGQHGQQKAVQGSVVFVVMMMECSHKKLAEECQIIVRDALRSAGLVVRSLGDVPVNA